MKVVWSAQAVESLATIYDYIYEDSPMNAEKVFNALSSMANSLSDLKVEFGMDLIINEERFRFIPKWSYKIIYERTKDKVVILAIFNSKQDPGKSMDF